MSNKNSIDTGDQVIGRRRPLNQAVESTEDTEGHVRRRGTSAPERGEPTSGRRGRVFAAIDDVDVEDTEGHVRRRGTSAPERGEPTSGRRRRVIAAIDDVDVEDTEGHVTRTYPAVATDDDLDCRMPLPGDEDERMRRL